MGGVALRFLNLADVAAAGGLEIGAAMAGLDAAWGLWRQGDAEMPAETSVSLGGSAQARAYALPARLGGTVGLAGVKWTAHRAPVQDGAPSVMSVTVVNDAASGLPVGIVESAQLTATRTAAASALAMQLGASAAIRRVTLLGAGVQATAHLRMLAAMFPGLAGVTVWNRTPARATVMMDAARVPWPIRFVPGITQAIADADAVICCTAAVAPILEADAFRAGRMILQIGYHEVSFAAIDQADVVLVDLWGEFCLTSAKSLFQMHRAGRFPPDRVAADLPMLVLDGWRPPADACVYFSSFGLNLFDVALAGRVLRSAATMGIGTMLTLG